MSKLRVVTGILSAVFVLSLVPAAHADTVQKDQYLEKLFYAELHDLTVLDISLVDTGYLYQGHFENNNGKHLGFANAVKQAPGSGLTMEAYTAGPRLQVVRPLTPTVVQNPEPTAMVLLGTGLAAAAAVARKNKKKSRKRGS